MRETSSKTYASDGEVEALVRGFEAGELSPSEFGHEAHLAAALWYSSRHADEDALGAMRRSILGFLARKGVDAGVYHETITVFWMRRVRAFLERGDKALPLYALANGLIAECGDARLIYRYYSRELIGTCEARARCVPPDVRPFDF